MKKTSVFLIVLAICMLFTFVSCVETQENVSDASSVNISDESSAELHSSPESSSEESLNSDEVIQGKSRLVVHYFDVGQGDSIFIELPDGRCMLIDASISQYEQTIEQNIHDLGYGKIDFVVATHPHADHIGGMAHILSSFEIGCIYMPNVSAGTKTYTDMVETILDRQIKAIVAEAGVAVLSEKDLKAVFLAPYEIDKDDQNKNSAVLYLSYGESSFLFMGDADVEIEEQIGKVDCDVLKVGHHGSRTASDEGFLRQASPDYAIISCGEGNSYGHPHKETLERLENCGAEILRTDLLGDIIISSDGTLITLETRTESNDSSENPEEKKWVLNTSSKKIHKPSCKHVKDIAEKNIAESNLTIEELMQDGYTTCGTCKPHD